MINFFDTNLFPQGLYFTLTCRTKTTTENKKDHRHEIANDQEVAVKVETETETEVCIVKKSFCLNNSLILSSDVYIIDEWVLFCHIVPDFLCLLRSAAALEFA